ncbi:MAG: hypothetical protein DHS20C21_04580 [Gemmatimonadota bacterium]|nr:MAG: hypothetical protein DHS20C21_04580 [Gemmatimonadota bacterium]
MKLRISDLLRPALACAGWMALLGATSASAQSNEYTIGVGDVLSVTVWQRPDLGGSVAVDSEGNVTLPLIGAIRASGQTVSRLGDELTRRLSFVDRDVSQVTVSVENYYSRRVFVMGEVISPGSYAFAHIPGVWDVLREAGGPTAEAALNRVRILPPAGTGPPIIVDLERVLATGDFSSLPELRPGSTILISRVESALPEGDVVFVYGGVNAPGAFSIDEAHTVLQAVLAAGGPVEGANTGGIRVIRPGSIRARVFEVDLNDYVEDGILFANLALLPGDTVTVPRSQGSAIWRGIREVARVSGDILGSALIFWRLGDDNRNNGTTTIVIEPDPTAQAQ